ncbi:DNA mismatch repair protein MutL [Annulohypoxylon maeteangense]|uniref:DNA mismatch repair protein MutL n=1 Tax=Annulohypoxylon maeteangense TaxID=1927788 RepID=UPI002008B6CE|nr:DNA mismatch repair protein MutL [Annulohypoxylon maeteangense]KAI0888845.1 DNA mismatch repair protein MutL [Annulohypoxylon maeteangense]
MATIKAIEARSVHQIQSGQVIVDLCSVVKELVENGLDAGATSIEVRFKNQGLDSIEVQDNGSGISKENYETIALKHYTSKLSTYSDLASLQTFGFRGEALSSLCALSKFTITTCLASDAPKGSRLEFETSGKLRSTTVVAAQKGTTVVIEGLFHNLPVRRRELERNIKREWNRVIGVLNQYACIKTGLKFSVSQQPTKGKRMVLFSTKGNQTTRENIVNVFGAKTLAVLIPLELKLELEPTNAPGQKWAGQNDDGIQEVHIKGHVSRPAHGEGRQTPDRQMFFVNGRPCGLPQFAKVFNEVYKSYNASQSPFIFADIQLDTHLYDVNVSPDKRTILLHDQTRMLDNLRESLVSLFESQDYALPTSQLSSIKSTPFKKPSISRQNTPFSQSGSMPSTSANNSQRQSSASVIPNNSVGDDEDEDDKSVDEAMPHSSASRKTPTHDDKNINLVSRWAERRSAQRANTPPTTSKISEDHDQETTKEARNSSTKFTRNNVEEEEDGDDDDLEGGAQDLPAPIISPAEAPSKETDFRARLAELSRNKADRRDSSPLDEPPIPAVSTSSRVSDIRSSRVSSSANLKRSAPEVATITVGNHTVTSIIGSPLKKPRVEDNNGRAASVRQRVIKESVTIPTFNGRLTQMFAAYSQSKQTDSSRIETTAKTTDASEESDASSEHLFVQGDDEEQGDDQEDEHDDEQENEKAASVQSKEDEEFLEGEDHDSDYQPPESKAIDAELQDDIPPSPTQPTGDEHPDDQTEETAEVQVGGTADATQDVAISTSEEAQKRTQSFIKGSTKKKDMTLPLLQTLRVDEDQILDSLKMHQDYMKDTSLSTSSKLVTDRLDAEDAEEKLSLTISKSDFGKMRIIGQFNLGFILAVRPANADHNDPEVKGDRDDELFIIDQHATDEKYNFERLQANTVVQSQRLVQPKTLELTALEEEVIRENIPALEANGFIVSMDESGDQPVGSRCQLLSLPLSRETTFSLTDLEELVSMLTDHQSASASAVPRPSKVRKMFAMRACRSSVMIGKHLTTPQMQKLVRHMGELDKPWNCPHGRPTMRHLCGVGAWSEMGWREGDGFESGRMPGTDWGAYVREKSGLE